jgi:hypothetical protein
MDREQKTRGFGFVTFQKKRTIESVLACYSHSID